MKYKKLGTTSLKISNISLGTMTFGEQCPKNESLKILDYSYENGVNLIDTAEMYPVYPKKKTQGDTERIIGDWLKKKKNRNKIFIASKICSSHPDGIGSTRLKWIRGGGKKLKFDYKNISKAVNESLKRLKTDYIDLYQLHWPERKVAIFGKLDFNYDKNDKNWTPFLEILHNLNKLIKTGKIRYIGVSNETPWGISEYINLSEIHDLPRIQSVQNGYNLINRVFDIANSEVVIRKKCSLLAYSPLAGGRLTGKYLKNKRPLNSRYSLWPGRFSRHLTKRGETSILKYMKLSKKYNISLLNLANGFVLSRPFVTSSIIGATSLKQIKENLQSCNIKLDNEILNEIEKIHLSDPNPCV